MQRYDPDERCPKCNEQDHALEWREKTVISVARDGVPANERPERLRVGCKRCGFFWFRAPLHPHSEGSQEATCSE